MAKLIDVLEFNHFISFVMEEGDELISVQYQADQAWRDEEHVWHVARDAVPVHISRKPAPHRGELSDRLMDTLADTLSDKG
jgi:hypothetical protein